MKRRCLLKVLPALCLPFAIQAQQGDRRDLEERIKREAEAAEHREALLPIYPREERVIVDAPFSATFLATIPSTGREYQIRVWRRSDGSTRTENVFGWAPLPVEVGITQIVNFGRMKSFQFLTVDGVLKEEPGIAESPIRPAGIQSSGEVLGIRSSGESLIGRAWKTLESEDSVILEGVDDGPCKRLLLESPYGSKTLEVWLSEDLAIIVKEELRRNGEMQHRYVATSIERSEPDPSLFEPRISDSASPSQRP